MEMASQDSVFESAVPISHAPISLTPIGVRLSPTQVPGTGCTAPKYLTEGVPSNIWRVYSPQIFDGRGSVKYLVGLHPPSI